MQVLLATFGTRGDVQPLLALALGLRAKGHTVRLCAPPDFERWVNTFGVPFQSVGSNMHAFLERARLSPVAATVQLREEIAAHFAVLERAAAGVDVVIASGAEVAARSVAEREGAAYRYLTVVPQQLPSRHHPPPYVPWPSLPPILSAGTWTVASMIFRMLGARTLNAHRKRLGLPPVTDVLSHVLPQRAIVACDPLLGPLPPDLVGVAEQTGSLLLDDPAVVPPEVDAFLARGPAPVCAGFGSISSGEPGKATEAIVSACRQVGRRLLLLSGWAGLGGAVKGDDVFTCPELPLPSVLPRACVMVHHGGSGMTVTAARAGVPQVVVPHFLDQPYWGMRVQALGLGPAPIPAGRLDAGALASAIRSALQDEVVERARELAPRIRTDGVAQTVELLEAVGRARSAH